MLGCRSSWFLQIDMAYQLEITRVSLDYNKLTKNVLVSFNIYCQHVWWWFVLASLLLRVKKVTHQRPLCEDPGLNTSAEELPWPLAGNALCFLTTCPPWVPYRGKNERRFCLPWGMMVGQGVSLQVLAPGDLLLILLGCLVGSRQHHVFVWIL